MKFTIPKIQKLCRYACIMLSLSMLMTLLPISALAEKTTDMVIRVGSFEGTYNMVNKNGERSGYGYEYLQNIAGYAGWRYEYIDSSWTSCFTQLENGEIDVLGGISYTEERAERMLFSNIPMGEEKYYIYTKAENTQLSATDLSSFNGKRIGVLKGHVPETLLKAWEEKYDIHMQHINTIGTDEIFDKLNNNEIDCFISVEEARRKEQDVFPVTIVGKSDIYFAINKDRPDIKKAIDSAMRRIRDDNPFYTDELYKRYLSAANRAFLSGSEKKWLTRHGAIRIGFLNNDTGISVFNANTGEMTGVITDYVQLARNCLQGQTLDFELKGYDTRTEQLNALHSGDIDLIFHVSQNPYSAEINNFTLSDIVWTFNMAATTAYDNFDENAENTVAVIEDNFALKAYISYNYPQWKIKEYKTTEDAVKAMKSKKVDCILNNSGTVPEYFKDKNLHSVFLTKPANACFAIRRGEPTLLSIMNKTIISISTEKFSGAAISYSSAMRKVTIKDFIRDNHLRVSLILITIFLLIMLTILAFLIKSRRATLRAMELNKKLEKNQMELQTALEEAQSANKAKSTFLSNMSHDIRTPINGIIGMLSVIEKSKDDPERVKDCLYKINISSRLLLSLINDVLDMAKLESDTIIMDNESVNLPQICDEITKSVSFQAEEAGLKVTSDHDDYRGIHVLCSPMHLKKVLMNLFTNSVKYNKPNGSINMSMKTLSRTEEHITIEFKIADTGIGMTEDFIENKLFTPFVQADNSSRTNYKGTGLGMPIVKTIVEKMGGSIKVDSKLGEGSCFTVVLPFQIDNKKSSSNTENVVAANIVGVRLLMAEDNELNAEIAQFMLEDSGATVETVQNGLEAFKKFESSEPGTYNAILMDVMMPVMDGLTATSKIRALDRPDAKTIPIIAMTANVFKEDIEKCISSGMNAHLAKPLEINKLIETIYKLCEKPFG